MMDYEMSDDTHETLSKLHYQSWRLMLRIKRLSIDATMERSGNAAKLQRIYWHAQLRYQRRKANLARFNGVDNG